MVAINEDISPRWQADTRYFLGGAVMAISMAAAGSAIAQSAVPFETPNPAMFVAQDDDTTIYMLGTVHALPCAPMSEPLVCASGLTPMIRNLIASSGEVWLETVYQGETLNPTLAESAFFHDSSSLSDFVPADEVLLVSEAIISEASTLGLPASPPVEIVRAGLDLVKPWAARALFFDLLGSPAHWTTGVDFEVEAIAIDHGIPVLGFATQEEHINLFAAEPFEYQVAFLRSRAVMLRHGVDLAAVNTWGVVEAWALWKIGDLEGLSEFAFQVLDEGTNARLAAFIGVSDEEYAVIAGDIETVFPLEMQEAYIADAEVRLLADRNRAWMSDIESMLDRPGTFFIAVGAAHIVGDVGLPTLLEEIGARVKRMQ